MADVTLRSIKGSALTHDEVDDNFSGLNTELGQKLVASNNLSDVSDAATSLNNLGATDVNGAFTGTYDALHPVVNTVTTDIDMNQSFMSVTLGQNTTFTASNLAEGRVSLLKINRDGYTILGFPSGVKWANGLEPDFASYSYWVISFVCHDATNIFASATGHSI